MAAQSFSLMSKRTGLEALATTLDGVRFSLPGAGAHDLEAERRDVIRTVREYLLPRLRDPDAPVVAAIVGPTGSGKSVLINSIAQEAISPGGVLRPTTTAPVLWANREHAGRYWAEFIGRVQARIGPAPDVVLGSDPLTADLTIIDTPPFDHVAEDGTNAAREVLSLSDLCVFVTTPARYADAAAWKLLARVRRRGIPILFVLNRLPIENGTEVALDYARQLFNEGLLLEPDPAGLFTVLEQTVEARHGGLPADVVGALRKELGELADPAFRQRLVDQTSEAAVLSLDERVRSLANSIRTEADAGRRLLDMVRRNYDAGLETLRESIDAGGLAWMAEIDLWEEAVADLVGSLTRHIGDAAQRTASEWEADPIGRLLLADHAGHELWRHGHDAPATCMQVFEALEGDLGKLAASRTKRGKLRNRAQLRRADLLWRTVVVPDAEAPRVLRRRYRDGLASLLTDARALVERAMETAFDQDGDRFTRLVQQSADLGRVADGIETQLDALLDDAPVGETDQTGAAQAGEESPDDTVAVPDDGTTTGGEAPSGDEAGMPDGGDQAPSGGEERP